MNLSEHREEEQVWQKIAICQGPGPEQLGYKAGEQGCWGSAGRQGWQRQLSPGLWKAAQAHQRRSPQPLPARKRPEGPGRGRSLLGGWVCQQCGGWTEDEV